MVDGEELSISSMCLVPGSHRGREQEGPPYDRTPNHRQLRATIRWRNVGHLLEKASTGEESFAFRRLFSAI